MVVWPARGTAIMRLLGVLDSRRDSHAPLRCQRGAGGVHATCDVRAKVLCACGMCGVARVEGGVRRALVRPSMGTLGFVCLTRLPDPCSTSPPAPPRPPSPNTPSVHFTHPNPHPNPHPGLSHRLPIPSPAWNCLRARLTSQSHLPHPAPPHPTCPHASHS